ncbi:DUF4214 domain-containing protein [Archangium violaceum]|uniref:DUF4214 domain-containing protein n=1 Tax=Archangium violaceum TaxID=83451 RepID=UPI00194DB663|nr:DUF4214 domain-containing protein [Archangium violaceum]QRO02055.1 DUF4214 domain-containing protein [Archangium violaceum]
MSRFNWLSLFVAGVLLFLPASEARAFDYGVNLHPKHVATVAQAQQTALVLSQRKVRVVRLDVSPFSDISWLTQVVTAFKDKGITVEAMLYDPKVNTAVCGTQATEQEAYNATYAIVNQMKSLIRDWEIQNERQLKIAPASSAMDASPYQNDCGYREAAVNRGMSRAIRDVRASSGVPLRIILGFIGRGYGFLDFMLAQGVQFDVVGYHIYPWYEQTSLDTDPWFGTGGLFANMARFNRPVRINEFNCAEVYSGDPNTPYGDRADYENQAGQPVTERCFQSINKHLRIILAQTKVALEGVTFYQLLDQPELPWEAERRFGLMYDINTPKVQLMLVSAFAGGSLTTSERSQVTSRGLLTDAEINANQAGSTGGPTAAALTHFDYVAYLYRFIHGRDADASGQSYWTGRLEAGSATRIQVQVAFYNSTESLTRRNANNYTPAPSTNTLSHTDFVKYAYIVLLGRDADASGLNAYVNALQTGATRADVIRALMTSSEYRTRHGL